jgi:hypothetical protein
MTRFEFINANIEGIRKYMQKGLILTSVLNHYTIYSRYDYYRKLGNYVGISVMLTSEDYKVSEILVRKIIHEMEESI